MSEQVTQDEDEGEGQRRIGFLDIETLSLSMDAVVSEVGMVVANMNRWYEPDESSIKTFEWKLPVVEQVMEYQRSITQETLMFHFSVFKEATFELLFGTPEKFREKESLKSSLLRLRMECERLDELWMNHPTFDSGRLHSLYESVKKKQVLTPGPFGFDIWSDAISRGNGLWSFRIERDIATIRKAIPEEFMQNLPVVEKGRVQHRGVDDAKWNMAVVQRHGQFLKKLHSLNSSQLG